MNNKNVVSIYLEQTPNEYQIVAKRLMEIILSSNTDMSVEMRWGKPTFGLDGDFHHWICAVQILKNKVSLIFHFGGLLVDEKKRFIAGTSKFLRKLEYVVVDDINDEEIYCFIEQAIEKLPYFKDNWKEINNIRR